MKYRCPFCGVTTDQCGPAGKTPMDAKHALILRWLGDWEPKTALTVCPGKFELMPEEAPKE